MSEQTLRQRLELGIEVLDSAIQQVLSLSQDSLTREWLRELHERKRLLVGQLQLIALEYTDPLAQIVEEQNEDRS